MNENNASEHEDIDALLSEGLVQVPEDFKSDVMQRVAEYERERQADPISEQLVPLTWWQWSALLVGSLLGISQVLRFVFAVWFFTTAV